MLVRVYASRLVAWLYVEISRLIWLSPQIECWSLGSDMISLLIVDDHPVYRDALQQYLSRRFHSQSVQVFDAATISEGIELAQHNQDSLMVLLDLSIPDAKDYLSGIVQFKAIANVVGISAISGLDERIWKDRCIDAGCQSFISKNNEAEHIYRHLRSLMEDYLPEEQNNQLTNRQLEILKRIVLGHSNKMIAYEFNIKEQTVKIHINSIFKELKVSNRTQAAFKATQLNLI